MVVASDEKAQGGAEPVHMAGKSSSSAVKGGHIAAQVGVSAFDGIGLLFAWCHIMAGRAFSLPVNQLAVGRETIAVELLHQGHQRKHPIHQRLHRFNGAFFDHFPSQDAARFAVNNGGYIEELRRVFLVFFSPVFLSFFARLALQKV